MIKWILHDYPSLNSTNDLLKELARDGVPEGTYVRASEQKKGRGRRERGWHSPPGLGLYLSWLLRPPAGFDDYELLSVLSPLPIAEYLTQTYGIQARLKWPNDLLVGDSKLGGLLTESGGRGGKTPFIVVGLGLNCLQQKDDYPPWIRARAISLAEVGVEGVGPGELVQPLLEHYGVFYENLLSGNKAELVKRYKSLCCTFGRHVWHEEKEGTAIGLGPKGELVVQLMDGREETWDSL